MKLQYLSLSAMVIWMALAPAATVRADDRLAWPERVRVVYLPAEGRQATIARYTELTAWLQAMLAVPVEPVSFDSYGEMFSWMALGNFELAYLSPSTLCQARAWVGLDPIAMEADDRGRTGYRSQIICRADRDFRSLDSLSASTFAFTDPESTTGFLVPLAHFLSAMGREPGSIFGQVVFGKDHRGVIQGVRDGRFDAGAVSSIHLERILAETPGQPAVRVIWQSELQPGLPICVRDNLPGSFRDAVASVLWNYGADPGRAGRLGIGGYAPASFKDYAATNRLEAYRP